MIRSGGDVILPRVTIDDDGDAVYEEGLSEGNLHAMIFAAQSLTNDQLRARFGFAMAQVLIDRGFGFDQLPPQSTTPEESQRVRVEHALARGLVRDQFKRPMVP